MKILLPTLFYKEPHFFFMNPLLGAELGTEAYTALFVLHYKMKADDYADRSITNMIYCSIKAKSTSLIKISIFAVIIKRRLDL